MYTMLKYFILLYLIGIVQCQNSSTSTSAATTLATTTTTTPTVSTSTSTTSPTSTSTTSTTTTGTTATGSTSSTASTTTTGSTTTSTTTPAVTTVAATTTTLATTTTPPPGAHLYACLNNSIHWMLKTAWCFHSGDDWPIHDQWAQWWDAEGNCQQMSWRCHLGYPYDSTSWSAFQSARGNKFKSSDDLWLGCSYNSTKGKFYFTQSNNQVSYIPVGSLNPPGSGSTYCYTDKGNSYNWKTDNNGGNWRQYLCMMNALPIIVPTELSLQVSATVIVVNSMLNFNVPAFWGQDPSTVYSTNFGDNSTLNTWNSSWTKQYAHPGFYTVTTLVYNDVSGAFPLTVSITVLEYCQISTFTATNTVLGDPTNFTIVLNYGTNCEVNIDFGDGSPMLNLGTFSGNISTCNATNGCTTPGKWTILLSHTYTAVAAFKPNVTASNVLSFNVKAATANVETIIQGFTLVYPTTFNYYPYQTNFTVGFAATNGSNFQFIVLIDGNTISNQVVWDSNLRSGNVTVTPDNMVGVGVKSLSITAKNLVTLGSVISYGCQIEYMFTNFQYTPNPADLIAVKLYTLQFTWNNASHFNYTVDYGKGTPAIAGNYPLTIVDLDTPQWISETSMIYNAPGTYLVTIYVSNHVDSQTYQFNATVQYIICCVNLVVDYVGILMSAGGPPVPGVFSLIWNDPTYPYPTDAVYDFDFGNAGGTLTGEPFLNQINQTQTNLYNNYDTYVVTVNIHNKVSSLSLNTTIYIVVGFTNVQFDMTRLNPYVGTEKHNYYLITNEIATFSVLMDQGSNYNLSIFWNCTNTPFTTYSTNSTPLYLNHSCPQAGLYTPSMHIQNIALQEWHNLPIPNAPVFLVVQDQIQSFQTNVLPSNALTILYASRTTGVACTLQIFTNPSFYATFGTNPRYKIFWDDATANDTGPVNAFNAATNKSMTQVNHNYLQSGIYNVEVRVWNEVSFMTFVEVIQVYNEVTGVNIVPRYLDANSKEQVSPLSQPVGAVYPTTVYFPMEYTGVFHANKLFGSFETYNWTFNDGYDPGQNSTIYRTFTTHGTYVLSLNIANQPSYGATVLNVIIEKSVSNVSITDNSPWPRLELPYQQYTIAQSTVPTDACYFFDFIDPSANAWCRYRYMGNQATCTTYFPTTFSTAFNALTCPVFIPLASNTLEFQQTNTSSNAIIAFTHKYYTLGRKTISLRIVNHVSDETFHYDSYVTKGWCQFPTVIVRDLNRCLTADNCKCFQIPNNAANNYQCPQGDSSYAQGDRIGYQKDQLLLDADVSINCSSSEYIWFNWTVAITSLNGTDIRTANFLLNGTTYQSYSSKILVVPPQKLPGGRFHFTLTVSPNEEVDMDKSDDTYIFIQASNLVAEFYGNLSGTTVPQVAAQAFNAWTESFDPDMPKENKSGLQFDFYCRRSCESWPQPTYMQAYNDWRNYNYSSCVGANSVYSPKGCFNTGNQAMPGPMPLTSSGSPGQWSFSPNAGTILINTAAMTANQWYTLMVIVSKDSRMAYKEIMFYVSSKEVPIVHFQCVTNCQTSFSPLSGTMSGRYYQRVNPTSRFSIEAVISDFAMSTTYFYQWDLFSRPTDKGNNVFAPQALPAVPDENWLYKASTGRSIRTMCIDADLWNSTFQYAGFYLRLSFWVGSNVTGPAGQYYYEFFLNEPPAATGHCLPDMTPGMSMSPAYGILCTGYQDLDAGDLFYFVKQLDPFTPNYWLDLGSSKTSMMLDNIVYVNAIAGLESNSFMTTFKVRIVDSSGSFIEVEFPALVEPFDLDYASYGHPAWSILNYTATCDGCQLEDFFTLLAKQQRLANVTAATRTFATMLNENPSTGCIITPCDNSTQNCTEIEMYLTTESPEPFPPGIPVLIANTLGATWTSLSTCQLDLQLRIALRERMMGMFNNLQIPYFASFVQVLSALYTVTSVPQENTILIMKYVQYCLETGIANIDGVDPQMDLLLEADVREETCLSVTGIVANMEQTANYYGAIWRNTLVQYYPSFTMEGLVNEIKTAENSNSANSTDTNVEDLANSMWTPGNNTDIDNDTLADLMIIRNNITLIHVILFNIQNLKNNITSYVQARKVMAESPSILSTENLTAVYVKTAVKYMSSFPIAVSGGCNFVTGDAADMFGDLNQVEESIQAGGECSKNNPFVTDPSAEGLGGTVSLVFQNSHGVVPVGNLTKPIDAFVPRQLNFSGIQRAWNETQPFSDSVFVYMFAIPSRQAVSLILYEGFIQDLASVYGNWSFNGSLDNETLTTMKPTTKAGSNNETEIETIVPIKETQFVIFIKYWKTFEADNLYDDYCIVPKWPEDSYNLTAKPTLGDPRTCTVTYSSAMANIPKGLTITGDGASVYISVQIIPDGYTIESFTKTTKIASFSGTYVPVEYTLFSVVSSCKYYDNDLKIWKDDGTQVGPNTTLGLTHCLVTHLTSFASGFSIPMNNLNLQDSGFLHLAENPIAFVFCLCIICLYLILLVWCRRKDREDVMKAGIAPLPDNDPIDRYLYQIVFYTGSRPNAGTTSKIFFQLTGEEGETEVRLAEDSHRMAFRRNGIDTFIMAVPQSLGKLTFLRIWHDNTGASPNWYFSRLQLLNVQTGEQFFFVVDNWLAIDEGDGQVERFVPVAGKGDLIEFNQLFFQKSQKALFDGHIWFSVFRRPPRSHFTRVQRLTCCLSLIYCTMIANILFYGQNTNGGGVLISIGPVTISWNTMKIAVISGLIVVPVNTALIFIFRYVKPRPAKSPMKEYEDQVKFQEKHMKKEEKKRLKQLKLEQSKKGKPPTDVNFVHAEVDEDPDDPEKEKSPENPAQAKLEPPSVIHIDTRAKKKKFQLPHWFIYIGYALSFCTVAVGFWLIVQVAFGFGRAKAIDWVIAMFISLIQSIIFVQPIKIICLAIVYACLCKKPEKDEYEPTEIELREDEVYVHEMHSANDMSNAEKRRQIQMQLKRTRNALPPEMQALQNAREQRKKELAMYGLMKEIFFYALFLYTLMMVAYGERDQLAFFMVKNSQNVFVGGGATNMMNVSFNNIETPKDFYNWVQNMFLPALYPQTNYINKPLPSNNRYMFDDKGFLTGTARFRQLRVKQNSCNIPKQLRHVINHCRDAYSYLDEDTKPYHKQWKPVDPNVTNDEPDVDWQWTSMAKTKSNPFIGKVSSYWGGGYIADLGYTADTAYPLFNDLQANGWVDSATRAIFVEFALFYPSVNMFVISRILVEFMSTGGAVTTKEFAALRLDPYDGPNAVPIIIGDVCCLLFLLWFIYRETKKLMKEKKKYFYDFWSWLEIIVIALMITALVMYSYRMLIRKSTLSFYNSDPANHDVFNNFTSPLFWEELYSWMIYIVLFIANVKFLRILRFNRRISIIIDTMRYGWKYMAAFTCTLLIVFFAYAVTAYLLFSTQVLDFMDFLSTIEVLWVIMLNVFNYSEFSDTNRVLGPIFFVSFTLILNFIMVNMFLSIVNDSFAVVKHDDTKQNEYELVDFIWFKFKRAMGFSSVQVEHADGPMYAESQDTLERDLIDCNDKIEQMVFRMQEMFKEEKLEQQLKSDWRYSQITEEAGGVRRHVVISE